VTEETRKDRWRRVKAAVDRALHGVAVPRPDRSEVARFINEAVPAFTQAGITTYLVFGSYRGDYEVRLRAMAYELSKPIDAEATLIGDTADPDTRVVPSFLIKFHALAEFADHLVGGYEKESGGESPELGLLDQRPYFEKGWMFPRDYTGLTRDALESKADVIDAAIQIYYAPDADDETKRRELKALVSEAQTFDIDITEQEVVDALRDRDRDALGEIASYSWVHLNLFRKYELHDRCFPWFSEQELRTLATEVPGPARPQWEEEFESTDLGNTESDESD
jgi:hypothetical protein